MYLIWLQHKGDFFLSKNVKINAKASSPIIAIPSQPNIEIPPKSCKICVGDGELEEEPNDEGLIDGLNERDAVSEAVRDKLFEIEIEGDNEMDGVKEADEVNDNEDVDEPLMDGVMEGAGVLD